MSEEVKTKEATSTAGQAAETTEKKSLGKKIEEGGKQAWEKIRRLSDDAVKKVKNAMGKKEGAAPAGENAPPTGEASK